MKIKSITIKEYCRRLAAPLFLAHGVISERRGVIIRVAAENGMAGYGEAAPLVGFSPDTLPAAMKMLGRADRIMRGKAIPDIVNRIGDAVGHIIPAGNPAAVFGLETALCDLAAQASEQPLSSWLRPNPPAAVSVNYLIAGGEGDWTRVASEIKRGGYRTVKLKVGGGEPEGDIALVRHVHSLLGGDVAIRLDANRRWSFDSALRVLDNLRDCPIDYVEEPLSVADFTEMARLKRETGVRIALDETSADDANIGALLAGGTVDVVVIKPTVLGGIARAVHLAGTARRYNRQVVVTSTLETEIGLTALVHLAAAVCPTTACGLDTVSIFDTNLSPQQLAVVDGAISVPQKPGLGLDAGLWEAV